MALFIYGLGLIYDATASSELEILQEFIWQSHSPHIAHLLFDVPDKPWTGSHGFGETFYAAKPIAIDNNLHFLLGHSCNRLHPVVQAF